VGRPPGPSRTVFGTSEGRNGVPRSPGGFPQRFRGGWVTAEKTE
jgi:hypothetical protein